jgi:hypothetical protein
VIDGDTGFWEGLDEEQERKNEQRIRSTGTIVNRV